MANDISYIIKALDGFSKPVKQVQNSIDRLNRKVKTNNRLFQNQIDNVRRSGLTARKAAAGNRSLDNSMAGAGKGSMMLGSNLKTLLGIGAAYKGWQFAKELIHVRSTMDGTQAALESIMPKFYKTGNISKIAAKELQFLRDMSYELGVSFEHSVKPYSKFLAASQMTIKSTRATYKAFAGLSRLYGMTGSEFEFVMKALEQMQSKTVVTSEELKRQLGDHMPGVLKIFATAAKSTVPEFIKLMETGKVSANLMAEAARLIEKESGPSIVKATKKIGAEATRTGDALFFMKERISKVAEPSIRSFLLSSREAAGGIGQFFNAMGDKKSFDTMDDGMQNLVVTMKVLGGLAGGFVEAMSGIKPLAKFLVDIIALPKTGLKALGGQMTSVAGRSYKLSRIRPEERAKEIAGMKQPLLNTYSAPAPTFAERIAAAKAKVTVDFVNVPKGTKVQSQTEESSNLDLGLNMSYATGGAY